MKLLLITNLKLFFFLFVVALSIKQIDNQWRIDLFSIDNLQLLYSSLPLGISTSFCKKIFLFKIIKFLF